MGTVTPSARAVYVELLPLLRSAARWCGYALGVHGSMARDLDLIACPWVEHAVHAESLIEALRLVAGGMVVRTIAGQPVTSKPHRRRSWLIHVLRDGVHVGWLDVSVMPL